jgi:hypothetical protein
MERGLGLARTTSPHGDAMRRVWVRKHVVRHVRQAWFPGVQLAVGPVRIAAGGYLLHCVRYLVNTLGISKYLCPFIRIDVQMDMRK